MGGTTDSKRLMNDKMERKEDSESNNLRMSSRRKRQRRVFFR